MAATTAPLQGAGQPMIELVWFNCTGEAQKSLVPVSLVANSALPLKQETAPPAEPPPPLPKLGTNVYISRLPRTITQDQLEKLFQGFGPIISCRVVYHTQGKQGRVPRDPVGFVQFLSPDVAQTAIAQVNGMLYDGKRLVVRLADQDKDKGITSAPSDNLYIANLPKHFREPDLHAIFSPYGNIEDLVVLKHLATGQSKGSGMVRFSSVEEAIRAKDALNCARLPNLEYPLEVKFAESKQDKMLRQRQKLSAQRADSLVPQSPSLPSATPERQTISSASTSVPPSPCPSLFSGIPPAQPVSVRAPPSQAAVMSALEDYLKTMLPHPPATPNSGAPSHAASVWDLTPSDFAEGSLDSDPWERNTYGYSSDSNSDGVPGTPSSHFTSRTFTDLPRSGLAPQRPSPAPVSRPFTLPFPGSQPLSPLSGPANGMRASPAPGAMPLVPGTMSPLVLGSPPEASAGALQWGTRVRISNLPPGTTQLHLYQICARFGAILTCTIEKEENGATAWLVFKKAEEAAQVELKLDGHQLHGRKLQVQLC